ncbi:MAG: DUF2334 domain-containing protein [Promethearchaeota archaeon]
MGLESSTSGSRQTFILDFDDFSPIKPGFDLLRKLKEHFPNFKCTLFTPAFNLKIFTKEVSLDKFKYWGRLVAENQDWIEIAPHGFSHIRGEWQVDRKQAEIQIKACENVFKQLGIKIVKIFKFPYWEGSKEAEEVLKERGYTLAIDRNNPVVYTDIPTYVFNWSIDEPIPDYPIVRGHGHIWLTSNGLDKCFPNLLKIPQNSEFKFVSEYLWPKNTNQL